MLRRLGYTVPLHIELAMHDVRDIPWISFPSGFAETGSKSEPDNTVVFTLTSTTDDLQQRPNGLATDMLRQVFFAINWPSVADSEEKLDAIIRAGYQYNNWNTHE